MRVVVDPANRLGNYTYNSFILKHSLVYMLKICQHVKNDAEDGVGTGIQGADRCLSKSENGDQRKEKTK